MWFSIQWFAYVVGRPAVSVPDNVTPVVVLQTPPTVNTSGTSSLNLQTAQRYQTGDDRRDRNEEISLVVELRQQNIIAAIHIQAT